jgi:DNA helicase-2/ATP-dependent DNA helicase PcrA
LHAAKGLEFPSIFIVACEQGLLPHERSRHDDEKLEEERRLLFVGITRAREELQLSYAQYRHFRGQACPTVPSPFLMELPRSEMHVSDSVGSRRTTPDWEAGFEPGAHADSEAESSQVSAGNDSDFSQDSPPTSGQRRTTSTLKSGLMTAADLLARNEQPRISPNAFRHGMTVEHPEYGLGTIIALSGDGPKRTATVRFFQDEKERKFRLIFSNLRPVDS